MKVRGTLVGTPLSARLTALCWGALTLLIPVAVSACTSGASTAPPASQSGVFHPTPATGAGSGSPAPGVTSGSPAPSVTSGSPAPSVTSGSPAPSVTSGNSVPTSGEIQAGGGGTAVFQDALLLALGAAAILAGAGGLIYRRWLGRGR